MVEITLMQNKYAPRAILQLKQKSLKKQQKLNDKSPFEDVRAFLPKLRLEK